MNTKKQKKTAPAKGKTNTTSAKAAIPAKAASKAAKPATAKAKPAPAKAAAKPEPAKDGAPKAEPPKANAPAKPAPAKAADGTKPKLSLLKAAAAVLKETEEAMNTKQMVEQAKQKGLWTPGAGKTPEQTLYSAILREMKKNGDSSTFVLVAKGHFKLRSAN